MNPNSSQILNQRAMLVSFLRRYIGAGQKYALLDFPDHSNVGDSAIWLGEISLLKEITGTLPAYVCTTESYSEVDLLHKCPDGPIFFHGGGNFGDIWPSHQRLRERVLAQQKHRPIIQMPQSIHFRERAGVDVCAELISNANSYVLMVRDRASLAFAREHFQCSTELQPDAATGLGTIRRPRSADHDVALLLRTDTEQAGYDLTPLRRLPKTIDHDWLGESLASIRIVTARARLLQGARSFLGSSSRAEIYNARANMRVDRGLNYLSRGHFVVTDRLHGHILTFALGIPHVALDNEYGKVSGYIAAWNAESSTVLQAVSAKDAALKLGKLGYQNPL